MHSEISADFIEQALALAFSRVAEKRMRGLPINNPRLAVQVVGARRHGDDWFGVLITPWCMNLVVVPMPGSPTRTGSTGDKSWIPLPGGEIEFIASIEEGIGPFAACPLFSPMGDFTDQTMAIETAEAILCALFEPIRQGEEQEERCRATLDHGSERGLSRRDLLLGLRRSRD